MRRAHRPQAVAIAEGYIPSWSNGLEPEFLSHETASILNVSDAGAHVTITVYFSDREPAGPYRLTVPARCTVHQRFNEFEDPEPLPLGTDYASLIESDVPMVVQHTRLDSRQAENALLSTHGLRGRRLSFGRRGFVPAGSGTYRS